MALVASSFLQTGRPGMLGCAVSAYAALSNYPRSRKSYRLSVSIAKPESKGLNSGPFKANSTLAGALLDWPGCVAGLEHFAGVA